MSYIIIKGLKRKPTMKKLYLHQKGFSMVHYRTHKRCLIPNDMAYLMTNKIMEEITRKEAEQDVIEYYTKHWTLD